MITDMLPTRMADWLQSAWLARYLDRQLSAEESAWFEAYALDKPELLESIDSDTGLRDALAAEPTNRTSSAPVYGSTPETSLRRDSISHLQRSRVSQALALAASLVLAMSGGWFAGRSFLQDSGMQAVIANPEPFIVETVRGEAPSAVRLGTGDSPYVLIEAAVPTGAEDVALTVDATRIALRVADDGLARALVRRTVLAQPNGVVLEYRMNGSTERKILMLVSPRTNQ